MSGIRSNIAYGGSSNYSTTTASSVALTEPLCAGSLSSSTNYDNKLSTAIPAHELSKLLECPVCYEITLPPVIICTSGHNLCSECHKKCSKCPVCRSGFSQARNRLAECIVDKCSIPCRYRSLGCEHILDGNMLVEHLDNECEYRPITCRKCKLKIPYESYISHLIKEERMPRQFGTECSTGFDINDADLARSERGQWESWEPTWLSCYGLNFFCHLETCGDNWWIYVIGLAPERTLSNFLCDILVWSCDKKQEMRFRGPVHSYRKSGEEIRVSGQCIVACGNGIRSMLNQHGIDVLVSIIKVCDYQPPVSRNTGLPLSSPLTLTHRGSRLQ